MLKNPFNTGSSSNDDSATTTLLTARMFFGIDGDSPYTTPADFLAYGESLKPKEGSDLSKLINRMLGAQRMNGNPYTGVDSLGRPYTWHEFIKPKATAGFKIINGGGFPELVSNYQDGKVTINFTLEELIKVAREA
jgi:hypothetical protein